ncbi:PR domain zinc finger protein 14-like [Amblyomma americanum]
MFEFLASGKSTVKGVPVGVFTLKALPKGLHIGPYHGVKVDCIENGGCTWPVRRCGDLFVVEGRPQQRNHWMNDVNYSPSMRRQNLVALLFNGDIYYRTLRNVGPDEELLVGYSTSFAKSLLGNPRGPGTLKRAAGYLVPPGTVRLMCECAVAARALGTMRFSRPDNLKVHMMIYSGEKPYECSQCGKRLRERVHARRHEEVIHSRRYQLNCPRCGAGVEDVTRLRRHRCKPLGATEGK